MLTMADLECYLLIKTVLARSGCCKTPYIYWLVRIDPGFYYVHEHESLWAA